jgi:cellulose synthase/poly-beta-1,6-N-acetylglucosamine synthase-like glycosyltransferase
LVSALVIACYFAVLGLLALVGVHRLVLTLIALRARQETPARPILSADSPRLVVQLPIYQEAQVAERLLRHAAHLRYPKGRWSIQVLDDSTDETRAIVQQVANELSATGVDIQVIRRDARTGFKAGALAYGLTRTEAELVAIFDADFLPPADFLERTVPTLLASPDHALVQARWGHVNRERSLLTRAQAIFLDGHFGIEHRARSARGLFFNFNGTAGVWRRKAIESAGGWSDETLTEDLDLSYRSQLSGGVFRYLDDVVAPAELPESWSAFRSQQSRWVRGSVETARKHLGAVLSARALRAWAKLDALVHLLNNFAYLLMAVLAVLLPAAVIARNELSWRVPGGRTLLSALDLTMLTAGTFAMVVFYAAAAIRLEGRLSPRRLLDLAFALCVGAGMSVSNACEVLRGLSSKRSIFVRTPKRGDADKPRYAPLIRAWMPLVEIAFAVLYLGLLAYAVSESLVGPLPFALLYFVGFSAVGGGSMNEAVKAARSRDRVLSGEVAHFTSSR